MPSLASLSTLLAVAAVGVMSADNRPIMNPYDQDQMIKDVLNAIPANKPKAEFKWPSSVPWDTEDQSGSIPEWCYRKAKEAGQDPNDIDVYSLNYPDCPVSFEICHHQKAQMSFEQVKDWFGRIPSTARGHINRFIVIPADRASAGYVYADRSIIYRGQLSFRGFFHEIYHGVDRYCEMPGKGASQACHQTDIFRKAVADDGYAVDSYARTSEAENFAQVAFHTFYNINVPGGLPNLKTQTDGKNNWDLAKHEVEAQTKYCKNDFTFGSAQCASRDASTRDLKYVSKGTGKPRNGPMS